MSSNNKARIEIEGEPESPAPILPDPVFEVEEPKKRMLPPVPQWIKDFLTSDNNEPKFKNRKDTPKSPTSFHPSAEPLIRLSDTPSPFHT